MTEAPTGAAAGADAAQVDPASAATSPDAHQLRPASAVASPDAHQLRPASAATSPDAGQPALVGTATSPDAHQSGAASAASAAANHNAHQPRPAIAAAIPDACQPGSASAAASPDAHQLRPAIAAAIHNASQPRPASAAASPDVGQPGPPSTANSPDAGEPAPTIAGIGNDDRQLGPVSAAVGSDPYQHGFAQRWGHLHHPRVRALAWLLDAPDLLDPAAPHWQGRIATLGPVTAEVADWLAALDRDPAPLDAALGDRHYSRLGLYAEKLLAFYFASRQTLVAHGLQVRASRNDTVGEFDFLLRDGAALVHLEFATKFYLLNGADAGADFNGLIGPNLADTLGAKMRKIFDKQLILAQHPAAQPLLPQAVERAQALVKGWLFYPHDQLPGETPGISREHCHGFWMPLAQLDGLSGEQFCLMPRLQWLAPLKMTASDDAVLDRQALQTALESQMAQVPAPVMVAVLRQQGDWLVEQKRGFIVPDDWRDRAAQNRRDGLLP